MPVLTPGPTTSSGASAHLRASCSHSRISTGTVEAREIPSTLVEVQQAIQENTELVGRRRPLGRDAPVVAENAVRIEAENGLRVADVDGEQHRPSESERLEIGVL